MRSHSRIEASWTIARNFGSQLLEGDQLGELGRDVCWFSEKDVGLGTPLLRAIDKGLAKSRVGIVLVTPALLRRLPAEGIADKELSAPLSLQLTGLR